MPPCTPASRPLRTTAAHSRSLNIENFYENHLVSFYFFPSASAGADVRRIRICLRKALASKAFRNRNGTTFLNHVYQCDLARTANRKQTRENLWFLCQRLDRGSDAPGAAALFQHCSHEMMTGAGPVANSCNRPKAVVPVRESTFIQVLHRIRKFLKLQSKALRCVSSIPSLPINSKSI